VEENEKPQNSCNISQESRCAFICFCPFSSSTIVQNAFSLLSVLFVFTCHLSYSVLLPVAERGRELSYSLTNTNTASLLVGVSLHSLIFSRFLRCANRSVLPYSSFLATQAQGWFPLLSSK